MSQALPEGIALRLISRCLGCFGSGRHPRVECFLCHGTGVIVTDYRAQQRRAPVIAPKGSRTQS